MDRLPNASCNFENIIKNPPFISLKTSFQDFNYAYFFGQRFTRCAPYCVFGSYLDRAISYICRAMLQPTLACRDSIIVTMDCIITILP